MSLRKFALTAGLIGATALSACAQSGFNEGYGGGDAGLNKQQIGTGLGAVVGGLAGSRFGKGDGQLVGTGVGVLLGALVGSSVGASLDKADLAYAQQAQDRAYTAPIGQTISWNNPQSGNSGTYTPIRDGRSSSGSYCREYQQTIYVGGQQQTATGTACQNPDGTWKIVN
ncbi:MAG: glycine zipper 2TM domain-containing protein [Alphaproteobacteria bacterium]|nr:glycine zipper 2TM domain-containing protein [Alphaproteobacteria bacterium]USO07426.1 MAG: glycine zipper 2TM domain-containing protein [Rhodospirillales bacterium]